MQPGALTDTHCHLNHSRFDDDRDEAITRARLSSVERLLVIGYDLASSRFALEIAIANSGVQAVIGIHPDAAAEWPTASAELSRLAQQHRSEVVGWGEIGLDYYWDTSPRDLQQSVFEEQLAAAAQVELPVVLHCRDAYDDVLDTLERLSFSKAVLHCFTGTAAQAQRAVDLGLWIGVGGIATFKKSTDLRAVVAALNLDRILIETDSPYLAPQAWRGKRNEPAYVRAVAEMLADLHGTTFEEIARATSENADRLFGAVHEQDLIDR